MPGADSCGRSCLFQREAVARLTAGGMRHVDFEASAAGQEAALRYQWLVGAPTRDGTTGRAPGQQEDVVLWLAADTLLCHEECMHHIVTACMNTIPAREPT